MNTVLDQIKGKEGLNIYILNTIQYKTREKISTHMFESLFREISI